MKNVSLSERKFRSSVVESIGPRPKSGGGGGLAGKCRDLLYQKSSLSATLIQDLRGILIQATQNLQLL
ncbi:hypothetical protein LEP1GSC061_4022 [Leptospira wolffii serovar Khorat str. Khorat-H2]|nr:hypothetical protein LEP1GSC061_4022 [Leptospira wolffii serovar Khorat str. Khorat-H2]